MTEKKPPNVQRWWNRMWLMTQICLAVIILFGISAYVIELKDAQTRVIVHVLWVLGAIIGVYTGGSCKHEWTKLQNKG